MRSNSQFPSLVFRRHCVKTAPKNLGEKTRMNLTRHCWILKLSPISINFSMLSQVLPHQSPWILLLQCPFSPSFSFSLRFRFLFHCPSLFSMVTSNLALFLFASVFRFTLWWGFWIVLVFWVDRGESMGFWASFFVGFTLICGICMSLNFRVLEVTLKLCGGWLV